MKTTLITLTVLASLCIAQDKLLLTLDEALEMAFQNSPNILTAQLSLQQSRDNLDAQQASLKSSFRLQLTPFSFRRDRQFNTFFNTYNTNETKTSYGTFAIDQPLYWTDGTLSFINRLQWQDTYSEFQNEQKQSFSNNVYLSYRQPLFTYNRTKLAVKQLQLDYENQSLNYAIERLALELRVTRQFYDAYQKKLSLEIAREEYENQKKSYEIISNKVQAGLAAKEELYQAELNLASSESAKQNQEVLYQNALDQFKQLLGLSIFQNIDVAADVSHQPVEVDLEKAIESGISSRMELRQRQINIKSARFRLVEIDAQNEFKGDMEFILGIFGTDEEISDIYETPTRNQQFSFSLEIPLFDWGANQSRIKAQTAAIERAELSLEEEKKSIIINIRQIYRSLQNQEFQIDIARKNVRNAQLTYEINLERYRNGDLTSMDLNLYQTQLSEEQNNLVSALVNYKLDLLDLKIQSMYDFRRNKPILPTQLKPSGVKSEN
ncbi:TolC family protein [candidate division KSB1 bacterium]|jgi:outer membrane protein TolC|nr:TolC family protein [candidate division KSB1 bacterium]